MSAFYAHWITSRRGSSGYAHCAEDDPEQQKSCDYYQPHPRGKMWCFFNYDAQDCITDGCHLPGVLGLIEKKTEKNTQKPQESREILENNGES